MEFIITRENFLDALSRVQGVVEKKNTMPVLSNVLLEADKNGLRIRATDLEVALLLQVPAQIKNSGNITVLSRSLHDIVREIPSGEIHVKLLENDRIELKSGQSQFNIPGLSASEYPALPKVEAKTFDFPCEKMLNMIEKTAFCISTDETRHNLAGILFQMKANGTITAVATDGHRLSVIEDDPALEGLDERKVIIPRKGVNELKKIAMQGGNFELAIGEKNIFARKGNETVYIRLIDGDFPDYTRLVPQKNDRFAIIPKKEFIGALRRVSLLSNERSRGVVLQLQSGHLEVSINNPDLGEAHEELKVDYQDDKIRIGFNAKYFLDVLDVLQDDQIILAIQNELAPCTVKAEKDAGYLCVLMPMRI